MLEIWLQEIALGVIATLIGSALMCAFHHRIWQELKSLYVSVRKTVTVLLSLCTKLPENFVRLLLDIDRARFSAAFGFQVSISRSALQRESVRVSTASAAPTVRISDSKVLNTFPATYGDLVAECRKRYSDFKQNNRFHKLLESVKRDPCCAHERRLNPSNSSSSTRMFYNLDAVLVKLDDEYTKRK